LVLKYKPALSQSARMPATLITIEMILTAMIRTDAFLMVPSDASMLFSLGVY